MSKLGRYHTLVVNFGTPEEPTWSPEFGGYDREVVWDEGQDTKQPWRIIVTGGQQAEVNTKVARLNSEQHG